MSTLEKKAKAKKRRKDYKKKRNVARNNSGQNPKLKAGEGVLPASKKNKLSKKTLAQQKKARGNAIRTATNN